jgi:ubiquinone/menaquinone biosynthesis C-methylase UbiE
VIKKQLERHPPTFLRGLPSAARWMWQRTGRRRAASTHEHNRRRHLAAGAPVVSKEQPSTFAVKHATILDLPFGPSSFDGAYNLGVLEHFTPDEIQQILAQLHRVIKPGGKLVMFWPHSRATSVAALRLAHWIMNDVMRKPTVFHPPEISLLRSKKWVESLVRQAGFRQADYSFGPRDLFVQAVVVAEKPLAG